MPKFAVQVDKTTGEIGSTWQGPGPAIPAADAAQPFTVVEVDEATYNQIRTAERDGREGALFRRAAGKVEAIADPRPRVRATPSSIRVARGTMPRPKLRLEAVDDRGGALPIFSEEHYLPLSEARRVQARFSGGSAELDVATDVAFRVVLRSYGDLKLEAPVEIEVYETMIS